MHFDIIILLFDTMLIKFKRINLHVRVDCTLSVYSGLKKLDRNLITLKFLSYEKVKTKIHG